MTTVAVVTCNCAKELQAPASIAPLVKGLGSPSFLAFCLQELAPIHDACLRYSSAYLRPFITAVRDEYTPIAESVCGSTGLVMLAHKEAPVPRKIETDQVPFGMLWSTLKGAALVSLQFGDNDQLTVVSAHLAAGETRVAERNRDFGLLSAAFDLAGRPGQVIIGGDLNYRTLDGTLATDQLSAELQAGNVASGLHEHAIEFDPTYKFLPGTSTYTPKRVRSFCDRVLFRELPGTEVITYTSLGAVASDHHPVGLLLSTKFSGPAPNSSVVPVTANANRILLSYLADLTIGFAVYPISTRTGRIGLGFAAGLLLIYIFIIN